MTVNAIILDNKPCCPKCLKHSGTINSRDYKEYRTSKGKATLFKARCDICGISYQYFAQLRVNTESSCYFVGDLTKATEIKDTITKAGV